MPNFTDYIFSVSKAAIIFVTWKYNFKYNEKHLLNVTITKLPIYNSFSSTSFSLNTKKSLNRNKTGKVKTTYSHDVVRVDADVNIDLAGPLINLSGVAAYQGWLAGYKTAFDTQKSKVTVNNFALGYTTKDFVLHTNV